MFASFVLRSRSVQFFVGISDPKPSPVFSPVRLALCFPFFLFLSEFHSSFSTVSFSIRFHTNTTKVVSSVVRCLMKSVEDGAEPNAFSLSLPASFSSASLAKSTGLG